MQVVNNVAEEYVGLGKTDFATPEELCQVILWLRDRHTRELQRKDKYLDRIIATAFKGRLYTTRRTAQPRPAQLNNKE